jgi:hypothetical protein
VCGPKIRHGRSIEVGEALRQAESRGMGVAMLTLTVRHSLGQPLADLFSRQEKAWRALQQSRAWRVAAARVGLVGMITAREVTYGVAGWHPHRHVALVTSRPYGRCELEAWGEAVGREWLHQLGRVGLTAIQRYGVDVTPVTGTALARYLEKVEGVAADGRPTAAARELVRGDLKTGRRGGVTAEELAEMVCDGEVAAVALWLEYARATEGRRMLTWTRGLRELLACELEATDDELAALDVGGVVVALIEGEGWDVLARSCATVQVLEAAEAGVSDLDACLAELLRPGEWETFACVVAA